MEYYAIRRSDADDEIKHWKYIKRVKGKNGKWRYIYDDSELKKYERGVEETNDYGESVVYDRTADLFDRELQIGNTTVKKQGDLSRAMARGEKWIYDNILKDNSKVRKTLKSFSKSTLKKGERWMKKLFG